RLATTRHPTRPPLSRSPDCRALQRLRPAVPFGALGPRPDPRAPARAQLCPWPPRHPAPGPTTTTAPRGNDTGPAAEHLSRTPRASPSRTGSVLELRRGPRFSRHRGQKLSSIAATTGRDDENSTVGPTAPHF